VLASSIFETGMTPVLLLPYLPTYHKNGLWFTKLKAIPAEDDEPAIINTLQAVSNSIDLADLNIAMADSDLHYITHDNMGGSQPNYNDRRTTWHSLRCH
jgi:hypothetical protein